MVGVYCVGVEHAEGVKTYSTTMGDNPDEVLQELESDPLYVWCTEDPKSQGPCVVRMVQALDGRRRSIILDSGADVSVQCSASGRGRGWI